MNALPLGYFGSTGRFHYFRAISQWGAHSSIHGRCTQAENTMQQTITYRPFEINSRLKKPELWIGIIVLTIGLSIVQDYVYSRVQNTGFYLSESLLYNSIWAFLVPLALLQIRLLKRFSFKRNFGKLGIPIVLGGAFTLVHIFIFSTFFVSVSYLAFSPTHHFSHIFNAALSNQFYVLALFYVCIPLIARTVEKSKQAIPIEIPERINVKIISRRPISPNLSINFSIGFTPREPLIN